VERGFNPRGTDFSVTGDWQIELGGVSMLPNPSNCSAAGIATVQLELYHETTTDVFTDGTLSAPCGQGTFTSTMTFAYGTYRAQWVGRGAGGAEVARSGFIPFSAFSPTGNVVLPTAVFVVDSPPVYGDFTLNLFWVDPAAPTAPGGDCAYAKVTHFVYELTQGSTLLASSGGTDPGSQIPCATRLDIPELAPGNYDVYIEGWDNSSGIGETHMTTCSFGHSSIDEVGDCDIRPL
jgi:hypothetical protein